MFKSWLVASIVLLYTSSAFADLTGHFSRANCFNNESITFIPLDPGHRAVISWHTESGTTHYAGDEDPVFCSSPPCPTGNLLEDARCEIGDNCLWPYSYHTITGRWAAIHNTSGFDNETTTGWTVQGRHTQFFGSVFGVPVYYVTNSGPVTDCNL